MGLSIFIGKSVGLRIFMEEHVGPSVFMGESVGLQMNTWGPWGSRCSWRNVGGEAPHTVSTIYLKVFPGPAVGQASKEYTQKRSHTAFKYPASRSPLPYGCIKIAMGSRAFELALPQSWSRGRAADRNIDAE